MKKARYVTSKTFPGRALKGAAVVFIFAALLGLGAPPARARVPQEDVMDTAQTPAGELSLVRRREGGSTTVIIKLGGRMLAEKAASPDGYAYESASFRGLYPRAAPRYALVSFMTGALVCGAKFTVVDLSREGAAKASRDFGNCSDAPRVSYRRGSLTLTFPAGPREWDHSSHYVGPGEVWSYGNGRLRRVGRRR